MKWSQVSLLTRLWVAAAAAAVCTTLVALAIVVAADARRSALTRVDRVSEGLVVSQLLERHMVDIETGLRGYVPTGDRLFLEPLSAAAESLPTDFATLEASARGDRAELAHAVALQAAVDGYVRDYVHPLAAHAGAVSGARLDRITRRGKRLFDGLRSAFDRVDSGELAARTRAERSAASADRVFSVVALLGVGGLLGALLWFVVYTGRVVVRPVRRVIRACAAIADGERDTELPVTGPAELRELAAAFNTMAVQMAADAEGLEREAALDPLTGLLNRRGFEASLAAHTAHGQRYGVRGTLLLVDLDNFKAVNDTLGHARGDELLVACAGGLTTRLRDTDSIGRIGGDEFAVLLPEEELAEGARVAAHLVAAVAERAETVTHGISARVSASIGVAEFREGDTPDDVLARADAAMYEAKAAGRNRFAVARDDPARLAA